MEINKPKLFLEISNENFIFIVANYDSNLNFKVLDILQVKSEGIKNEKIVNVQTSSLIIQQSLDQIEKKFNIIFKNISIISNQENFKCINISGFKKLNGNQLYKEDISFILNNLKKLVLDNEKNYSLIHLFNSRYVLDNSETEELPLGLHGDFYHHQLTFFLLPKNDLKNIKLTLNNSNLNIEKIILKNFVEGISQIKKYKEVNFFRIIIGNKNTSLIFFNKSSYVFSENFNFGIDIIIKDVSKLCSLPYEIVENILNKSNFINFEESKDKYVSKSLFNNEPYRKISLSHIKEIVEARVKELINIIYNNNPNLQELKKNKNNIVFVFNNLKYFENIIKIFKFNTSHFDNVCFEFLEDSNRLQPNLECIDLIGRGWEREAIPVIQAKKSLISSFFSKLFD